MTARARACARMGAAVLSWVLALGGGGGAPAHAAPPDFQLTLTSGPMVPSGPLAIESVTVHADGRATVSARRHRGARVETRTVRLDPGAVDALARIVDDVRFFTLQPLYRDESVLDGDFAIIEVTAGGRTHRVKTVNVRVRAFDRLALWVNSYFDPPDMVIYNSFLGYEAKEVDR